jgi:hypothetical protein
VLLTGMPGVVPAGVSDGASGNQGVTKAARRVHHRRRGHAHALGRDPARAIAAIRDPRSNAFEVVPAFWATITMFPLGLVTLIGGISGRGKHFKRARTAFTIGVALLILVLLLEILRRMSQAMAG